MPAIDDHRHLLETIREPAPKPGQPSALPSAFEMAAPSERPPRARPQPPGERKAHAGHRSDGLPATPYTARRQR